MSEIRGYLGIRKRSSEHELWFFSFCEPFIFWRKPLFLSEVCWKSGVPTEGEREGESRPFRGRKGRVFPARESRKGHFGSIERGDKGFFRGEYFSAARSDFSGDLG